MIYEEFPRARLHFDFDGESYRAALVVAEKALDEKDRVLHITDNGKPPYKKPISNLLHLPDIDVSLEWRISGRVIIEKMQKGHTPHLLPPEYVDKVKTKKEALSFIATYFVKECSK